MSKSKKDLENEEEQLSATTHAIAMSIQKNEKFITLRDTSLLYYFNPEDGQYHEGETFLKEIWRPRLLNVVLRCFTPGGFRLKA